MESTKLTDAERVSILLEHSELTDAERVSKSFGVLKKLTDAENREQAASELRSQALMATDIDKRMKTV